MPVLLGAEFLRSDAGIVEIICLNGEGAGQWSCSLVVGCGQTWWAAPCPSPSERIHVALGTALCAYCVLFPASWAPVAMASHFSPRTPGL